MEPAEATPSDLDLIRAFAKGERVALAALAERYEGPLLGMALALMQRRRDVAADAVQDTWVRVIRHAASFDGRSSVKTWLYRILINRCNDLRIDAERRDRLPARAAAAGQVSAEPVEPGPTNEARTALTEHLLGLPSDQRTVLLLCYHADMSHAQAADILGIPIGTLKSRLHAALTALRTALATRQEQTR